VGLFFDDPLFEDFTTTLALGLGSLRGAAELGEVQATCACIDDGDDQSWFAAWRATGDRLVETGDACAGGGHRISAREAYLRASVYYALAYHPLFGAGPDPRLLDAFGRQRAAFDKAAALVEPAPEAIEIDFEGASMPGYLFRAVSGEQRPLLIATNGYDATIYEMFLGQAVPALRRGYHCLVFDGPGQGAVLFEQGVPIRADWETVIRTVVDAVVERADIDAERIALSGWSLGGYLALRAASGEPRLAACIADPALLSIGAGMVGRLRAAGVSESVIERYPDIDDDALAPIAEAIHGDRAQRWAIEQRGFWVHGVGTLGEYVKATFPFSMDGRLGAIRCPTALTAAESDPLSRSADKVYDELRCPKTLLRFTAAEGAGDHCEMRNRSLLDQRLFDWLDDVLATPRP
jgi:alpha-beta hydrolase superfamily lysophospholipase